MKIAVITGASSGIGHRFAETIGEYGVAFDEVWVIARRAERLKELKLPYPVRPIPLDLTDRKSFRVYTDLLEREKPDVALLINCSGFGKFAPTCEVLPEINLNMVDLNVCAVMMMCQLTKPYMHAGARVLNVSSVAAFQPIPYINVYASTKAFILSFSRALNREWRNDGVSVMALCPFWTKTEFFDRAILDERSRVVKKYTAMYTPSQIVRRAWHDLKAGKDICQFGFVARLQAGMAKVLPHSFVMSYWQWQQKLR